MQSPARSTLMHKFIVMTDDIFEKADQYIAGLLAPEDEALKATTQSLHDAGIGDMSVSANQGKLLQVLAMACNARQILEIGTFAGYSTIWLARILPAGGKVVTLEYDETYAAMAQNNINNAGLADRVDIRIGKASELLPLLKEEIIAPFDMIFIDADKPPYAEYFEHAIKMSRPGTIIVADNVIRNGKVLDENTEDERVRGVQRLNQLLSGYAGITATILQTVGVKEYDGMAIAVVNYTL